MTDDSDHLRSLVAQPHYGPTEHVELTTAIVFVVANATGVDPRVVSTQPLHECVDVEAVETVLSGTEPVSDVSRPRSSSGTRRSGSESNAMGGYVCSIRRTNRRRSERFVKLSSPLATECLRVAFSSAHRYSDTCTTHPTVLQR